MAESQLAAMEDGRIGARVPESRAEFYYSEEQRGAVEELLRSGDGAFKTRLLEDEVRDFLSAREVKVLRNTFRQYRGAEDPDPDPDPEPEPEPGSGADSGLRSTYWPQMSDTDVPPLDLGWPGGGFFRGVTRVSVHTHPPKDGGPHIKEVVRRLIQEAGKAIAVVMDLLTDLQILQDLMDAASRRSVPVYILLDQQGVPHFLDMCSRLQIAAHHLRNMRARSLQGVGLGLSFGRLPGALCNKYMLVDGDKVVFGSYSFSWSTSRMDRNMITVMSGQVVEVFDRDFRELYAVSEKMDLCKEFHVSLPSAAAATPSTLRSKAAPKRPPLPATTSRFQVTLGDSRKGGVQVPAHKFYNPKYSLVFGGEVPRPPGSLQEPNREAAIAEVQEELDPGWRAHVTSSERLEKPGALASEAPTDALRTAPDRKKHSWRPKFLRAKASSKVLLGGATLGGATLGGATPADADPPGEDGDNVEVMVLSPSKRKNRKSSKLEQGAESISTAADSQSVKSRRRTKQPCKVS